MRKEREPNDDMQDCNPIVSHDWQVSGEVNGDHDWFCFNVDAGQNVTFDIDARDGQNPPQCGSSLDSVIYLHDQNGGVIEQNDDADGLDSLIQHNFQRAGRYVIEVLSFGAGDGCRGCNYVLNIR